MTGLAIFMFIDLNGDFRNVFSVMYAPCDLYIRNYRQTWRPNWQMRWIGVCIVGDTSTYHKIFLGKSLGLLLELDNYLKLQEMLSISVIDIKRSVQITIKCQGVCMNTTYIFCLLMYLFFTARNEVAARLCFHRRL